MDLTEPKTLTPARLAELGWKHGLSHVEARDLFQHIDALTAEVAAANEMVRFWQTAEAESKIAIDALTAEVADLTAMCKFLQKESRANYNAMLEVAGQKPVREAPLSQEPT